MTCKSKKIITNLNNFCNLTYISKVKVDKMFIYMTIK